MLYRAATAFLSIALVLAITVDPALAHTGEGYGGGFISGFTHPILGWDHVAAMVAVGLWGAFLGAPAIWILPVVFPLVMAFGAVAGIAGIPVPAIETGIALSSVVLGLMIVFAAKAPIWVAAVIVGAFAIFHGYAHGTELPLDRQCLRVLCWLRGRHWAAAPDRHRLWRAGKMARRACCCPKRRWTDFSRRGGLPHRLRLSMRSFRRLAWLPFLLGADPAFAHAPIPGIKGFYIGLIHPFSTPAQALLMLGLGLLIGGLAVEKIRWNWGTFSVSLFAGLIAGSNSLEPDAMMFASAFAACEKRAKVGGCPEGRHIMAVSRRRQFPVEKRNHMHDDTITRLPDPSGFAPDALTEVIRSGARKLIEQAIEAELAALLSAFSAQKLTDGRARLVAWDFAGARSADQGSWPGRWKVPRLRDRGTGEDKISFTPSILPRHFARRNRLRSCCPGFTSRACRRVI